MVFTELIFVKQKKRHIPCNFSWKVFAQINYVDFFLKAAIFGILLCRDMVILCDPKWIGVVQSSKRFASGILGDSFYQPHHGAANAQRLRVSRGRWVQICPQPQHFLKSRTTLETLSAIAIALVVFTGGGAWTRKCCSSCGIDWFHDAWQPCSPSRWMDLLTVVARRHCRAKWSNEHCWPVCHTTRSQLGCTNSEHHKGQVLLDTSSIPTIFGMTLIAFSPVGNPWATSLSIHSKLRCGHLLSWHVIRGRKDERKWGLSDRCAQIWCLWTRELVSVQKCPRQNKTIVAFGIVTCWHDAV